MVKGVNKSVIEISETGSKYFSKVILFVSPEYVQKKSRKLNTEAENIIKKLQFPSTTVSLRKTMNNRKKKRNIFIFSFSVLLFALVSAVVLNKLNIL